MKLRVERGMQHCVACRTEYVAGITSCADCSQPLSPGPLPENGDQKLAAPTGEPVAEPPTTVPDEFLTTLPGWQADQVAAALSMEGVVCLLECEGQMQLRGPGQGSPGALAATLPVSIHVVSGQLEEAKAIVESLNRDDVVGDLWQEDAPAPASSSSECMGLAREPTEGGDISAGAGLETYAPEAEGTGLRIVLFLALAILVLFLLFSSGCRQPRAETGSLTNAGQLFQAGGAVSLGKGKH